MDLEHVKHIPFLNLPLTFSHSGTYGYENFLIELLLIILFCFFQPSDTCDNYKFIMFIFLQFLYLIQNGLETNSFFTDMTRFTDDMYLFTLSSSIGKNKIYGVAKI